MAITSTLGALLVYGRFMKLIALLQPYHSTCWGFPAKKTQILTMVLASEFPVLGADQVQNGASPDEVQGARVVLCGFRLFFPQRKETQS